jgi:hypothetical protein
MPNLPEANCYNKFEDCVIIKLHFELLKKSWMDIFNLSRKDEIDISMTIRFGQEQFMELDFPPFNGKVYFGIMRGELEFTLENCRFPIEKLAFCQAFQILLEVDNSVEKAMEIQVGTVSGIKKTTKELNKAKFLSSQVEQVGGERLPKWIFKSKNKSEPLLGYTSKEKLGVMILENRPCEIKATFTVSKKDIWINRGKIAFVEGQELANNKFAIIERIISRAYIGRKLDAPISEVSWKHV